jgi:hypothetical protein
MTAVRHPRALAARDIRTWFGALLAAAFLAGCGSTEPPPGAYELQTQSDGGPADLARPAELAVRLLLEPDGEYLLTVRDDSGVETQSGGTYMFGGNRLALCDSRRCRVARLEYAYARSILTLTLPESEADRIGEPPFRWGLKKR